MSPVRSSDDGAVSQVTDRMSGKKRRRERRGKSAVQRSTVRLLSAQILQRTHISFEGTVRYKSSQGRVLPKRKEGS